MESKDLDSFEKMIISDFLGEHWDAFENFCGERDVNSDHISEKLLSD